MDKATRPVTIKDIAAHCGVSASSVSYALKNSTHVSPEKRERILAAMRQLGYDPAAHESARRLVASRRTQPYLNHLVALFFPASMFQENGYFARMAEGAMDELNAHEYGSLLNFLLKQEQSPSGFPPIFHRGEVDGAIAVTDILLTADRLKQLRAIPAFGQRPVISLIWRTPGCSAVLVDDEVGGTLIMQHLLELGHRHILALALPHCAPVVHSPLGHPNPIANRYIGMHRTLHQWSLDPRQVLHAFEASLEWIKPSTLPPHHTITPRPTPDPGADAHPLVAYLRAHPEITAICAHNDPSAFHAWSVLTNAGIRVPEDISIVGYDDTDPIYCRSDHNLLTTIRTPLYQIGCEASRLMIRQLNDPQAGLQQISLPPELIVRGSTAPAPRG
jgi:DNA-binding LacI/PurR family transcriptional regulator